MANLNLTPFTRILKEVDVKNIANIIAANDSSITTKNVVKGNNTISKVSADVSSKLGPIEESNEMIDILAKIYGFMKQSNADKVKRLEKENNFKEEQDAELLQKHKELIAAIRKLRLSPNATAVGTDGEESPSSFFPFDLPDFEDKRKDKGKPRPNGRKSRVPKGRSWASKIAGFGPVAATLGALPLYLMYEATNFLAPTETGGNTEIQKKIMNKIQEKSGFKPMTSNVVPEEDLAGRPLIIGRDAYDARKKRIKERIELGHEFSPADVINIKKAYNIDVPKENIISATEKPTETNIPQKQTAQPAESKVVPVPPSAPVSVEKTLDKNESIVDETQNAAVVLNRVIKENLEAKLESKIATSDTHIVNNNVVNGSSSAGGSSVASLPSIRNQEPTLQRMILDNTRVV